MDAKKEKKHLFAFYHNWRYSDLYDTIIEAMWEDYIDNSLIFDGKNKQNFIEHTRQYANLVITDNKRQIYTLQVNERLHICKRWINPYHCVYVDVLNEALINNNAITDLERRSGFVSIF